MKDLFRKLFPRGIYILIAALVLFLVSLIINRVIIGNTSVNYYTKTIEKDIIEKEIDFLELSKDTSLIQSLISKNFDQETLEEILDKNKGYAFFIYERDSASSRLVFWNTQTTLPPLNLMETTGESKMVRLDNGLYVSTSQNIILGGNRKYTIEGLIPVLRRYFVEIENLKTSFVNHPDAYNYVGISFEATPYPIKSSNGNILFYLESKSYKDQEPTWLALVFIIASLFMIFFFIHQVAQLISKQFGLFPSTLFLILAVFLVRFLTYRFPELFYFHQLALFDPQIYSSSVVFSSLGDLLINALLFLWIITFINRRMDRRRSLSFPQEWLNWLLVVITLGVFVLMTFLFADIIQSLVADGQISFNVTKFFSLSEYSFIGFIILAILALCYFFLSQIVIALIKKLVDPPWYISLMISAAVGLAFLTFVNNSSVLELNLFVLIWLMLYLALLQKNVFLSFNFRFNISDVLFWLFIFSISISTVIIFENRKIEFEQRMRFAQRLSEQADPSSETKLSIALTYLDNDFLSPNFERFKVQGENKYLKDSIISRNFSAYHENYETVIYTFDDAEIPLFNEESISFDTLSTIFSIKGKATSIQDLRYFEKSFDQFSYLFKREVVDSLGDLKGYFFVLSEPKRYRGEALIPELFKQTKALVPEYSPDYSYGIYNQFDLISNYNDYPFPTNLEQSQIPKSEYKLVNNGEYEELWYRRSDDKIVVIVKKDNSFIEGITLFAYIFSTFILLLIFYRIGLFLINTKFKLSNIRQSWQLSIRSQIHSTIILVTTLSFVVIGVATIIFFIKRHDRMNEDRLSRAIQIMVKEVESELGDYYYLGDPVMLFESGVSSNVERMMQNISDIHGTDVNLYDTAGNLRVSSNPIVYNKGVLSLKMNPEAFYHLNNRKAVQYLTEEQMGAVNYFSMYCPVRDESGVAYAYLNIPFFSTQAELKQEISNFLVTIINLNAFIFLIAGAIALFITNRITESFIIIGQKMRDINLQRTNQEIQWRRNDEIGELVKEYNKMLHKLDQSAEAMAKSEREGAWRQMARQVAHEIKNPLTPMKLSIQYLQKAIDNNSPNVKEMTGNVARTLVEQIDHLSKIASDFSQFANIGNPKNEVFDLHDLLNSLASLYQSTENLEFSWEPVSQKVMVFADKTQLNRLFTNLFQNAIESAEEDKLKIVEVRESLDEEFIIVSVSDNGSGIAPAMRDKIFTPNFTTKSSGTGLGLAMSKSIAEQARGDIWFETEEGVGTKFFVKLPYLRALRGLEQ